MQYAVSFLAFAASAYAACEQNYAGSFLIANVNQSTADFSRPVQKLSCTKPTITIENGVMTDQDDRTAEVVANDQFQFDSPLQDPRKYAEGFAICTDDSNPNQVLIGHPDGNNGYNTSFFACDSGGFANLYDESQGGQCYPIYIQVVPCEGGDTSGTGSPSTASSTSSPATSSAVAVSTSAPVTSAPPATVPTSAPVATLPSAAPVAPYPTGNATAPAPTGTGSPSSTAPGGGASTYVPGSSADALAIGSKFGIVAAAAVAFAML